MRNHVLGLLLLGLVATPNAPAAELPQGRVLVSYAFQIVGSRPAAGQAYCRSGFRCRLSFDFDPADITLTIGEGGSNDRIEISCKGTRHSCVFSNERRSLEFNHAKLVQIIGVDAARPKDLAARPTTHLGKIWLRYRKPATEEREKRLKL